MIICIKLPCIRYWYISKYNHFKWYVQLKQDSFIIIFQSFMPILSSTSSKIHTLTNYISYPVVSFAIFDSMDVITLLFELFLLLFIKKYPKIGYSKYICIIFSYNTIDDSVQFLKQVSGHKRGVVSLLHWVCYRFLAHVCKRSSLYS